MKSDIDVAYDAGFAHGVVGGVVAVCAALALTVLILAVGVDSAARERLPPKVEVMR